VNEFRTKLAEFIDALVWVYSLCIIAWIIVQFAFAMGLRMPWSRPVNAVLDFLRDVSEPLLRIFRRLGLQIGPIDLSPIVALIVLRLAGSLIVGLIDPS
jgi:YggT family protein